MKQKKENVKKKTLIVGDSIVKHIDGWCLSKRMRSTVSAITIQIKHDSDKVLNLAASI